MYKRILVTLDRSEFAEQALVHAVAVAKAFGSTIELLSVVPLPQAAGPDAGILFIDWDGEVAECEAYLAGVVSRLTEEGLKAESEIRRGEVTEEILRHAEEMHADLLVMSTHGRSGLGRWVYGSVADRVLRHAAVPVLLVRVVER